MPRNGAGVYSLPAGNPVVTGTIINSTVHNNTMSDIAAAITASLAKNGETVVTGSIDYNGNALILDVDGDSKMEMSTDDRWDITIGGALKISITADQAGILDALAKLAATDGNIIVGNGTTFVAESGSTARQSLGVDLTTKGSLLAGNGTNPVAVAAGTDGQVLSYASGQASGLLPITLPLNLLNYTEYNASDTWTKPATASLVYVEAIGGGAGGGNFNGTGNASGGSGGEFVSGWLVASTLAATVAVTVGDGGVGGAIGGLNDGTAGGNSSFGTHIVARGGNPGVSQDTGYTPVPGITATEIVEANFLPLTYTVNPVAGYGGASGRAGGNSIYGGAGGAGAASTGGSSVFGGNGGADAADGEAPGGGGGGSQSNGGGGDGGKGRVRVWTI